MPPDLDYYGYTPLVELQRPIAVAGSLVALGHRTLLDPELRRTLTAGAQIVYVRAPGTDPAVHQVLSSVAAVSVAQAGRHEQRVAQDLLQQLGLDVELPP